jgi:hypothetical protein
MVPTKLLQGRIRLALFRWVLSHHWHGPARIKATSLDTGLRRLPLDVLRYSHTAQQPSCDLNESQYHSIADLALEEILSRLECLEEAVDDVDITLSVRYDL